MLGDPRFVRANYVLFAVAVLAALLKLGGATGAEPTVLQTVPTQPVAERPAAPAEDRVPDGPLLDWPEEGDAEGGDTEGDTASGFTLGGRLEGGVEPTEAAPVFRRPSPDGASSTGPVCGDLGDFPRSSRVVFPLPERYLGSYEPGWGSPRPQGGHEGTDLMSPTGTPEFALTDGTIVEVAGANENGWNRLGGYTVMLEAAYDVGPIRKGDLFYYAHMDRVSALPAGARVRAGQQIGVSGDTGEGPEVTRGKFPSHLHLGWYDASGAGARSDAESGAMDPYPLLRWLEENGAAVSGGTDASYCEAPQGPMPGPTPLAPGERPDMDTGDDRDARPSPVVRGSDSDAARPGNDEKRGAGRPELPDPGITGGATGSTGEATGGDVPAPDGPEERPDSTNRPPEAGGVRGDVGKMRDLLPDLPRSDHAPFPAPGADREHEGTGEQEPDAGETGGPEREERPDEETPEDRPGPAGGDPRSTPGDEEDPGGDAAGEENPGAGPEPPDTGEDPPDASAAPGAAEEQETQNEQETP